MEKLLTLEEWAKANYAIPPARETLRRWARDARIYPPAEKQGRAYYVRPDARYIDPNKPEPISRPSAGHRPTLVERIRRGA